MDRRETFLHDKAPADKRLWEGYFACYPYDFAIGPFGVLFSDRNFGRHILHTIHIPYDYAIGERGESSVSRLDL